MRFLVIPVIALVFFASTQLASAVSITTSNSVNCTNGKCTQSTSCEGNGCPQNNPQYKKGYNTGIMDWNKNGADTSHHFICPQAKTDPHGAYCTGYDNAIQFETSDQ